MRPYRGKRKDNGEWVYGWYANEPMLGHVILTEESDEEHLLIEIDVDLATVGQAIGRQDKNGKEIYEGDDVDVSMSFKGGNLPHRGVIVYDNDFGAFGTKNEAGITLLHNHCLHTLEIIGNIHTENQNGKEKG